MSPQGVATTLLLPPLLLVLVSIACALGLLVLRRGRRVLAAAVLAAGLGQVLLATPYVSASLRLGLQREVPRPSDAAAPSAGAIIVLSAEAVRTEDGEEVGPLTLERLRAGARLARATGLPLLVTGGPAGPGRPSHAELMARVLAEEFGLPVRWVEPRAPDTAGNARFSAAMLRAEGIGAAYAVTHAWHMPRALEAFAREGFTALPAPVRRDRAPEGILADWVPRPDHLGQSWLALREWAGRLVYALRDGPAGGGRQ